MFQFVCGFVTALLVVTPVVLLLLHRKTSNAQRSTNGHLKQLEELSKLTGVLAHEIKNPLSTIKINLKLISEELEDFNTHVPIEQGSQKHKRALRKITVIQKETERLEQILDGFLKYIDRTKLQPANVDINELVGDMIDFYSSQAQSHSIIIHQGLYNEPLICKVDVSMLKQVILNLFINAQQAIGNGGELIIRTAKQKNQAVIQISDTGCGIAPDKVPKIFDAFYSSRPQGSGLGLSIAEKIVEAHNGTITVDSEQGRGTSFTIKLPLQNQ